MEVRAAGGRWTGAASLLPPEEADRVIDAFAEKYRRSAAILDAWRRHPPTFVQVDLSG